MRTFLLHWALLATCLCLAACEKPVEKADPASMHLVLVRPEEDSVGVYLNEPLVFDFSHEVDRASVTARSLRIELTDGSPARGEFLVEGKRVTFEPAAVLSVDLRDGGYLPGLAYNVTLLGFPAPDGLRGVGGEPLKRTRSWSIRTVKDVAWPREDFVFADDSPDQCAPLFALRAKIAPNEAILLGCKEPLDPSSLFAVDFELRGPSDPESIPMNVRLIRNEKAGSLSADDEFWPAVAVIELTPLGSLEEARKYEFDGSRAGSHRGRLGRPNLLLTQGIGLRLADFSGNPVPPASTLGFGIYLEKRKPTTDEFRESFIDTGRRKPIPIVGLDGAAHWSNTGTVTVRYPRAAGTGADGDVDRGGLGEPVREASKDLHSIQLRVGEHGLDLSSEPGLCVLRSQGRMLIKGPLRRKTGGPVEPMRWRSAEEPDFAASDWLEGVASANSDESWSQLLTIFEGAEEVPGWDDLRDWFDLAHKESLQPSWEDLEALAPSKQAGTVRAWAKTVLALHEPLTTLSKWLEGAQSAGENWTVLVAGGDLVIDGSIEMDTPLLLVAGGMIRINGEVHVGRLSGASREELYMLGDGGGRTVQPLDAQLQLDPPQYNQLVRPMSFGILSTRIPMQDGPIEWGTAELVRIQNEGRYGGTLKVSYVSQVPTSSFDPEGAELFIDPSMVPGPVHFFIRIEIPAAPDPVRGLAPWRPPSLDAIILKPK